MPKARPSKEFVAFDGLVGKLLTVPKAALKEKIDAHKAESAQNPRKRGPKPKGVTPSTSDASHDAT
jgi:hypothetical protein